MLENCGINNANQLKSVSMKISPKPYEIRHQYNRAIIKQRNIALRMAHRKYQRRLNNQSIEAYRNNKRKIING